MKMCNKCGVEKQLELFSRKGAGYQSWCKQCNTEHKREWILSNREKLDGILYGLSIDLDPTTGKRCGNYKMGYALSAKK